MSQLDSKGRPKLRADFNGLFSTVLCVSHSDFAVDKAGTQVQLKEGMEITAFDDDIDDNGQPDDLIASGVISPAPEWLVRHGSKWVLVIDENGVRHESDLKSAG